MSEGLNTFQYSVEMEPVMKVNIAELPDAIASDTPGPAIIDGNELMMLFALNDRAALLSSEVDDPAAREAIRVLSLALDRASGLLASLTSAMHHGTFGLVNYPEAISAFPGVQWRVETQAGRMGPIEKGPADPRPFLNEEALAFLNNTQPNLFERFDREEPNAQ